MARGRMISQTIDYDPEFNALSIEAQMLYLRAIAFLDRDGLIIGNPFGLLAKIAPLMECLMPHMPTIIDEWVAQGLVIRYTSQIGPVLFFKGFMKNQTGMHYDRESESRFCPPPGWKHSTKGLVQIESGVSPELVRSESGVSPLARARSQAEVKVKVEDQVEVKACVAPTAATLAPQQEMFGAVCEAVGWDYHTLSKDDRGQVAQLCGILGKANYTVDDIRRFMVDIWFKDWRWQKEQQHPTLKQLRQEIGKLRSVIKGTSPPTAKKEKGINGFRDMLAGQGIQI